MRLCTACTEACAVSERYLGMFDFVCTAVKRNSKVAKRRCMLRLLRLLSKPCAGSRDLFQCRTTGAERLRGSVRVLAPACTSVLHSC